jgi:hypothetical protein
MAPEKVYSVIALDLRVVDAQLLGDGERIELSGDPIFVSWYASGPLDDHVSVLDGLLQVPNQPQLLRSPIRDASPADLGGKHVWRDPPPEFGPLMFAVILPPEYTIAAAAPLPVQAKVHAGRLALFWLLPEGMQVSLVWQLTETKQPPLEEAQRINREALDQIITSRPSKGFQYDIALSFAGEDRYYVDQVAELLRAAGVRVFYDRFEEANLWGKNLYDYLSDVYKNQARYTVMFISEHYAKKIWTSHERRSAQQRALAENVEYILPARFDDANVPGLPTTVGYLSLQGREPQNLVDLIVEKLRNE